MTRVTFLILLCIFFLSTVSYKPHCVEEEQQLSIIFLNPENQFSPVWSNVVNGMREAAKKYGINFKSIPVENSVEKLKRKVAEIVAQSKKPDYLILVNNKQIGIFMLEKLKQQGIKVFFLADGFAPDKNLEQRLATKYPFWIGSLLINYRKISSEITNTLIKTGQEKKKRINTLMFFSTTINAYCSSQFRSNLKLEFNVSPESLFLIDNNIYSIDPKSDITAKINGLTERHKTLNSIIINDSRLADKAVTALEEKKSDVIVSALSYDKKLAPSIRKNKINVAFAGYAVLGHLSIQLLADHHSNKINLKSNQQIKFNLLKIDKNNLAKLEARTNYADNLNLLKFLRNKKSNNGAVYYYFDF